MNICTFSYEGDYKPTPMQAKIEKRVRECRDKILHEKVEPWWVVDTGKPLRVTMQSGRTISSQSCKFEGTLRDLFWHKDFIPPFLEDAIESVLQEVGGICREHGLAPEDYLAEAAGYLRGMVVTIYNRMADIDAQLGQSQHRYPAEHIEAMSRRITDHMATARLLAGPGEKSSGPEQVAIGENVESETEEEIPAEDTRRVYGGERSLGPMSPLWPESPIKRTNCPEPLPAWLWELDEIESELERALPDRDLYVKFSVFLDPSVMDLRVAEKYFSPMGGVGMTEMEYIDTYVEPDSGTRWLAFGSSWQIPFVLRCAEVSWSLEPQMPSEAHADADGGCPTCKTAALVTWYHFEDTKTREDWKPIADSFGRTQDAIIRAFHSAPDVVYKRLGRDLILFSNWPKALFYMSLCRIHPLLSCSAADSRFPPGPPGKFPTLWEKADYRLQLNPDIHTATKYAFSALRQFAKDAEWPGGASASDLATEPAEVDGGKTVWDDIPDKWRKAIEQYGIEAAAARQKGKRLKVSDFCERNHLDKTDFESYKEQVRGRERRKKSGS